MRPSGLSDDFPELVTAIAAGAIPSSPLKIRQARTAVRVLGSSLIASPGSRNASTSATVALSRIAPPGSYDSATQRVNAFVVIRDREPSAILTGDCEKSWGRA